MYNVQYRTLVKRASILIIQHRTKALRLVPFLQTEHNTPKAYCTAKTPRSHSLAHPSHSPRDTHPITTPPTMALFTPAELLSMHGLTLMICGAFAFQASGVSPNAMSSIYVGNGSALISFILALGCRDTSLKKGERGYKAMMICVHVAILWPILLGAVVGWRLWLAWNVASKAYLKPYFGGIVAACLLTSLGIASLKPKKEKKEKVEGGSGGEDDGGVEVQGRGEGVRYRKQRRTGVA